MTDPTFNIAPTPWRKALPRLAVKLACVVVIVWLARWGFIQVFDWIKTLDTTAQASAMIWLIGLSIAAYAILIAIPFVPAVEIGIALLVMEGANIAPFIYIATVMGLYLAFWIGQRVSLDWLHGIFQDLHMVSACKLLHRIKTEPREQRLSQLEDRLPQWIAPFATRYRYVTIAILLSVPGNFAIGGGGGIMMTAGLSRFFTGPKILLTLIVAVLPIPLIVWVFGVEFFS